MKKRKGSIGINFTPIGVLMGLFLSTMIALYTTPIYLNSEYEDYVDQELEKFRVLIEGVIGTYGYIHNTTGECSSSLTTDDLSAIRLNDCNDFSMFEVIQITSSSTDGTQSYFRLMQRYDDPSIDISKIYFDNDSTDNEAFYVYLELYSTRKGDVVEREFGVYARDNFTDTLRSIDWESDGLSSSSGGTTTDGKLRLKFKI